MSEYEEGYYDSQNRFSGNSNRSFRNGQAMGSLLGLVLGVFIRLVPVLVRLMPVLLSLLIKAAPFAPFLVVGLAVSYSLPSPGTGPTVIAGAAVAYASLLLLYFLKGFSLALRSRGNSAWLPVLATGLAGVCLVPAFLVHHFFSLVTAASDAPLGWGLAGALAVLTLITTHPLQDSAPALGRWAYQRGLHFLHG